MTEYLKEAQGLVDFINQSPTPYHAVENARKILLSNGFVELLERASWIGKIVAGGKYFVTRNASSIIAFDVGSEISGSEFGIAMVGAHTDSPCLRIKPNSKQSADGFNQIGVEQYGGLIAHSWFDRDLLVAGRVYIRDGDCFVPKLIHIDRPLLRIPTLAIHLDREVNTKFEFNRETKLVPIAGQTGLLCKDDPELQLSPAEFDSVQLVVTRHDRSLIKAVASELNVSPQDIEDFELVLCDHQKLTIGGMDQQFIFSPRLDNLTSCYTAVTGLVSSKTSKSISLISLFDHEEIGSVSAQGADSTFLPDTLSRLTKALDAELLETMAQSFMLSSDMAHGVHPNYGEKHESQHRPHLNAGPVIKINANQRYATNSPGIVLVKKVANVAKVPLQLFVVRNDSPCGLTIGPIILAKLGVRTLDLGNPQLSMHSIRETGGAQDVASLTSLFHAYFSEYADLSVRIKD